MKKIVSAWIEQIIEFGSTSEYENYINTLDQKGQKYEIIDHKVLGDVVKVRIRKQYNNNEFPNSGLKGV